VPPRGTIPIGLCEGFLGGGSAQLEQIASSSNAYVGWSQITTQKNYFIPGQHEEFMFSSTPLGTFVFLPIVSLSMAVMPSESPLPLAIPSSLSGISPTRYNRVWFVSHIIGLDGLEHVLSCGNLGLGLGSGPGLLGF